MDNKNNLLKALEEAAVKSKKLLDLIYLSKIEEATKYLIIEYPTDAENKVLNLLSSHISTLEYKNEKFDNFFWDLYKLSLNYFNKIDYQGSEKENKIYVNSVFCFFLSNLEKKDYLINFLENIEGASNFYDLMDKEKSKEFIENYEKYKHLVDKKYIDSQSSLFCFILYEKYCHILPKIGLFTSEAFENILKKFQIVQTFNEKYCLNEVLNDNKYKNNNQNYKL